MIRRKFIVVRLNVSALFNVRKRSVFGHKRIVEIISDVRQIRGQIRSVQREVKIVIRGGVDHDSFSEIVNDRHPLSGYKFIGNLSVGYYFQPVHVEIFVERSVKSIVRASYGSQKPRVGGNEQIVREISVTVFFINVYTGKRGFAVGYPLAPIALPLEAYVARNIFEQAFLSSSYRLVAVIRFVNGSVSRTGIVKNFFNVVGQNGNGKIHRVVSAFGCNLCRSYGNGFHGIAVEFHDPRFFRKIFHFGIFYFLAFNDYVYGNFQVRKPRIFRIVNGKLVVFSFKLYKRIRFYGKDNRFLKLNALIFSLDGKLSLSHFESGDFKPVARCDRGIFHGRGKIGVNFYNFSVIRNGGRYRRFDAFIRFHVLERDARPSARIRYRNVQGDQISVVCAFYFGCPLARRGKFVAFYLDHFVVRGRPFKLGKFSAFKFDRFFVVTVEPDGKRFFLFAGRNAACNKPDGYRAQHYHG